MTVLSALCSARGGIDYLIFLLRILYITKPIIVFIPCDANRSFFFSLLIAEIAKVRASLFQISGVKKEPLILPEPDGDITTLTEKVYVPVKEHPDVSNSLCETAAHTNVCSTNTAYNENLRI